MTDLDPAAWALGPATRARLVRDGDDARADAVLSPDERDRLAGFASPARRRQFRLGRLAARTLAADVAGIEPGAVALGVAGDGAPTVPGGHLSIAHTGRAGATAALAAVASGPVGVDLERVAARRPDLWRRILHPDEHALLAALGGPTDDVQTLLWTLKEAVLKGQRTGFRAGGRSVRLALTADGAPPAHGVATAASGAGRWRIAFGRVDDLWLAVAEVDGSMK
ncbi:4'-phosphopantetheinyl transferase family protein [Rubrivirga sp. IMCC45206]|uniref:4'-phosphopantetheinyl transferase family protein n=1 Tax=Rubrivirga sp. IMCC45206 TaxID=3391614 RepID=UPI00398FD9F6